jgi:hypothetical protein
MRDIQEILRQDRVVCYRLLSGKCRIDSCRGDNIKCEDYSPFHTAQYRRILQEESSEDLVDVIS